MSERKTVNAKRPRLAAGAKYVRQYMGNQTLTLGE